MGRCQWQTLLLIWWVSLPLLPHHPSSPSPYLFSLTSLFSLTIPLLPHHPSSPSPSLLPHHPSSPSPSLFSLTIPLLPHHPSSPSPSLFSLTIPLLPHHTSSPSPSLFSLTIPLLPHHPSSPSPSLFSLTIPLLPHHPSSPSPSLFSLTIPLLPHHTSSPSPSLFSLTIPLLPHHPSSPSPSLFSLTIPLLPHHPSSPSPYLFSLTIPLLPHHPSSPSPSLFSLTLSRLLSFTSCLTTSSLHYIILSLPSLPSLPSPSHPSHSPFSAVQVFRDFVPSMVFDSKCIIKNHTLGEGGFGAVFAGTTSRHGSVAVKEYASQGVTEENTSLQAELTAWEIYQNAGQEARVMYRLNHQNILQLLGVTLAPLRLLLELAPLGDLKACVQKFQQAKVKISRATLQSTMIQVGFIRNWLFMTRLPQVAEALNYLHNQSFIFRDIKPGNVLVWKFPLPETQWTGDQVVQLKLADYGICKQFTPQGERGVQGTKPYLPPEVLLHGGQEAYSTKLDVYSFGMFMYYLFSFGNPFEKEMRPPEALLSAGKRPELLLRVM